jgi:HEAT repeat protein
VLGARRDPAAVSPLLERLEDDHPDVVDRAVGALSRIGDARAVGPLIELSRRLDAGTAARLARVIGEIGGSEAEGYLLTVEAGHPDPRVRRAAREALGAIQVRDARTAARVVRQAHDERTPAHHER